MGALRWRALSALKLASSVGAEVGELKGALSALGLSALSALAALSALELVTLSALKKRLKPRTLEPKWLRNDLDLRLSIRTVGSDMTMIILSYYHMIILR